MKLKLIIVLIIYLSIGIKAGFSQTKLDLMIDHPIQSEKRYQLMKEYAQAHYGMDHANLINPQLIVIH